MHSVRSANHRKPLRRYFLVIRSPDPPFSTSAVPPCSPHASYIGAQGMVTSESRSFPLRRLPSEFVPHRLFRSENYDPGNPVLQLSNVSGPVPLLERLQNLGLEPGSRTPKVARKLLHKVLTKLRYILLSLSQWQ